MTRLAARVVRIQTLVTCTALLVVTGVTAATVHRVLSWKTDQQLNAVLDGLVPYLKGSTPADIDWTWLAAEASEIRPLDVRLEVRDSTLPVGLSLGVGQVSARVGCEDLGDARTCGRIEGPFLVAVSRSREDDQTIFSYLVLALSVIALTAGGLVAMLSGRVAEIGVRPLSELAERIGQIEPGTGQRIARSTNLAEIDLVSERFDELVARYDDALEREKRFATEASHELRTPLTLALAEVEALTRGESDDQGLARAAAALSRLSALVDSLLWFARAQGRVDDERMDLVNLTDIIVDQVTELRKPPSCCSIVTHLPDEALIRGEETLITRLLANLLDNAVKYGAGAPVEVRLTREADCVMVHVSNGGAEIPIALQTQIFAPFFRARAPREVPGFGLGLPFVRAVARAHGGDAYLSPAPPGLTCLVLRLPLVDWNDNLTSTD